MHRAARLALPCLLIAGLSCRSSQPAPPPAPAQSPNAPAAQRGEEGPPRGRGEFPGGFRRRVPLTPEQRAARRDSINADRQRLTDSLMATIAGRENEPAGQVFKNVKLLKDMPAGEFIKTMNEDYGKAIGRSCNFCHVANDFASDRRKEKSTARMMIALEDSINNAPQFLPQLKNRRGTWPHIECVTCHRGMNEPNHALLPP
ncbi:MAG TPA: c-type cytochrome [Gemmatimonadaceae bacterium]|nr:c-type cytochrome [Gemmatimonadaceae bacterium]